jgi:hypothetical protein
LAVEVASGAVVRSGVIFAAVGLATAGAPAIAVAVAPPAAVVGALGAAGVGAAEPQATANSASRDTNPSRTDRREHFT